MQNIYEALVCRFEDIIWTNETTVQLESHRRHSYRKKGEPAVLKPRPKHPTKVHVWAGMSKKGKTLIVIFEGLMDATFYITVKKTVYYHSFRVRAQIHTGSCRTTIRNTPP